MNLAAKYALIGLILLRITLPLLPGQQSIPRIGYVFPAGGCQGTSFSVVVGGQYLSGATNVHFTDHGIRATVLDYSRPMSQKEINDLKEKLNGLQEKKQMWAKQGPAKRGSEPAPAPPKMTWTASDEQLITELRMRLAKASNRKTSPTIAETLTLQVTMRPDAAPGQHEVRIETLTGLSNPLVFQTGRLPEYTRNPASASSSAPLSREIKYADGSIPRLPEIPMAIRLPATLNGQIMPATSDRYRFQARQGQQVVMAVSARCLIPYLPDAVPGWFQATLTLYDSKGNEIAYNDDYQFHPDPVLHFVIPKDGEYWVEIKDSLYRGREDFVYRLSIGELPFITSVFPLGGPAGQSTTVRLNGWNLPSPQIEVDATKWLPGIRSVIHRSGEYFLNELGFAIGALPEHRELEPNNTMETAQPIEDSIIINGRMDQPGDVDVFCFSGRAGQELNFEVMARRLNSPLDSVLRLVSASGQPLAMNDDFADKGFGLNTHHADSWLQYTVPSEGRYFVFLSDAQRNGGEEYAYRLRLSPPRPDFELRVVPSSINLRPGATVPITVYIFRKDGFTNPISLALKDAPQFILSGGWIPPKQDKIRLTLTALAPAKKGVSQLTLAGKTSIQGHVRVRNAVPAEDMMQAFSYRHLVPARELAVSVSGNPASRGNLRILSQTPLRIPRGGQSQLQVAFGRGPVSNLPQLLLDEPPEGVSIQSVNSISQGLAIVLQCDSSKIQAGLKGNLILTVLPGSPGASNRTPNQQARNAIAVLPAIPFEIVD